MKNNEEIIGEVMEIPITDNEEKQIVTTKKYAYQVLNKQDFVDIKGRKDITKGGACKLLSSFKQYNWSIKTIDVKEDRALIVGILTINLGEGIVRTAEAIGTCEATEASGLHIMTAKAETRALKRAIDVCLGAVIDYFVKNNF